MNKLPISNAPSLAVLKTLNSILFYHIMYRKCFHCANLMAKLCLFQERTPTQYLVVTCRKQAIQAQVKMTENDWIPKNPPKIKLK